MGCKEHFENVNKSCQIFSSCTSCIMHRQNNKIVHNNKLEQTSRCKRNWVKKIKYEKSVYCMRKSVIKHGITKRNRELLIKVYLIIKEITTRMGNMFRHNQQGIKSCICDKTFCGPYRPPAKHQQ